MDIASLGLAVDSDQIKQANLELRAMPQAASAAERAAQRWGLAAKGAGDSADEFSKRVQKTIRDLDFQTAQLGRSAIAQERFAALRRAGVDSWSSEGRAVLASVAALQAQRAATERS